jgi:hypothetical protein
MKSSTVVLIVVGMAALGGIAFLALKGRTPQQKGNVPPLNTQTGPANTPQAQFASLAGQAGSILATLGVKKLESLFN